MKKLFCLLLAFALLLTFGCKKDAPSEIPTEPQINTAPTCGPTLPLRRSRLRKATTPGRPASTVTGR